MDRVFTLDNINQVAKEFRKATLGRTVFAFHGPMGSGKTTFIHALCDEMGVKDVVGSPTFSLANEYEYTSEGIKKTLFHLDLYRIKNEEEAIRAGLEEILYSGNICLAEWPEKAPGIFPNNTVHIQIDLIDTETRRIKIVNI